MGGSGVCVGGVGAGAELLWWVLDEIKGVAGGEQRAVVVDVQIRKEGTTLFPCLSPN